MAFLWVDSVLPLSRDWEEPNALVFPLVRDETVESLQNSRVNSVGPILLWAYGTNPGNAACVLAHNIIPEK